MKRKSSTLIVMAAIALAGCKHSPVITEHDGYITVKQQGAPTLGYSPTSGVKLIEHDGYLFKDLARNDSLLPYEDWRLPAEVRAQDLAQRLTIPQIAGLMLYSNHQAIPATSYDMSTYDGKPYEEGITDPAAMTDNQRKFLTDDNLRHVLITTVKDAATAARWNNNVQAYVEGLGFGIPANNSSDPRNTARSTDEFNAGGGGDISKWPSSLGLAASFDPAVMKDHGKVVSEEYRALGFATALSPQIDLGTEPRWYRFCGTFGGDPQLSADMARAYCDGFQTSEGTDMVADGWGSKSVNAMVKHWPGGGPCESGRDAHYGFGKFAVYPGGHYELHKVPFTEGAFKLEDGTKCASAVMPYYTISTASGGEMVGNSFSHAVITEQLREALGYDGVVCTDWGITADEIHPGVHSGKPWGVENLSVAERHYKALQAGVDQFGGNNDIVPVLEAYEMGVAELGREAMDQRMRKSAYRLLLNIFRTGLFENPYLDPAESAKVVGNPDFMARGYDAQLKSIVMLKNAKSVLPLQSKVKAYVPTRHMEARTSFWGSPEEAKDIEPVTKELLAKYFDAVDSPEEADVAIVIIDSPQTGFGYQASDVIEATWVKTDDGYKQEWKAKAKPNGNGYYPVSLQYSDYTATEAREHSIAKGDPYENDCDRSYKGKTVKAYNRSDLDLVAKMREAMGDKPVIVVINVTNPPVLSEVEPLADAVLFTFDVQNQALLDILSGKTEPSGLLPFQVPADMATVEQHCEDTPHDLRCHTDAVGHVYDFGYGLNFSGPISDSRTEKYVKK